MFATILGRPGAGKSTLGLRLACSLDLPYVGGGQLLREYVREERPGWQAVQARLKRREDSPTEFQLKVLRERLAQSDRRGAILDGFPKTVGLADQLDDLLPSPIAVALYVEVPIELAEYRVAHRLICSHCFKPFPADEATVGAACGCAAGLGELSRRPDDEAPSARRVRESQNALALRTHYEADGRLMVLNGSLSEEALAAAATDAVSLHQ